jgi:hypothetical protein
MGGIEGWMKGICHIVGEKGLERGQSKDIQ